MDKKILIIDDSASIREHLQLILSEAGCDINTAVDGEDALKKLNADLDLIICDVNMPVMDGITFLKTVKGSEQYADNKFTPIIMLTTEAGEEMKFEGQSAGAKAWIVKPVAPQLLLSAVAKLAK